jgi:hypothetical protein
MHRYRCPGCQEVRTARHEGFIERGAPHSTEGAWRQHVVNSPADTTVELFSVPDSGPVEEPSKNDLLELAAADLDKSLQQLCEKGTPPAVTHAEIGDPANPAQGSKVYVDVDVPLVRDVAEQGKVRAASVACHLNPRSRCDHASNSVLQDQGQQKAKRKRDHPEWRKKVQFFLPVYLPMKEMDTTKFGKRHVYVIWKQVRRALQLHRRARTWLQR